jgi:hypothetical protein
MRIIYIICNFFCPAFVVAPRHPWCGEFIVFETLQSKNFFYNIDIKFI